MFCEICKREKHSGHFSKKPITTVMWHDITWQNEHAGRIPICDDCNPNSIEEIAKEVVKMIDVDIDVWNTDVSASLKVR